jgi:hypothetical protein
MIALRRLHVSLLHASQISHKSEGDRSYAGEGVLRSRSCRFDAADAGASCNSKNKGGSLSSPQSSDHPLVTNPGNCSNYSKAGGKKYHAKSGGCARPPVGGIDAGNLPSPERKVQKTSHQIQIGRGQGCIVIR